MGPISLLLHEFFWPLSNDAESDKEPETAISLLQIKALNGLNKASIRILDFHTLALKKGAHGDGERLYQAHFRPGSLYSWRNARKLCREVARNSYRFDVLFIETSQSREGVDILCPRCSTYWSWEQDPMRNLREEAERFCPCCADGRC